MSEQFPQSSIFSSRASRRSIQTDLTPHNPGLDLTAESLHAGSHTRIFPSTDAEDVEGAQRSSFDPVQRARNADSQRSRLIFGSMFASPAVENRTQPQVKEHDQKNESPVPASERQTTHIGLGGRVQSPEMRKIARGSLANKSSNHPMEQTAQGLNNRLGEGVSIIHVQVFYLFMFSFLISSPTIRAASVPIYASPRRLC